MHDGRAERYTIRGVRYARPYGRRKRDYATQGNMHRTLISRIQVLSLRSYPLGLDPLLLHTRTSCNTRQGNTTISTILD